jgi:hypothetical protein
MTRAVAVVALAGVTLATAVLLPRAAYGARAPSVADAAVCNREAHVETGRPAPRENPSLQPAPGTRTDRSGSVVAQAPDPLVEGMAAAGLEDSAYRAAYRACMAARIARDR